MTAIGVMFQLSKDVPSVSIQVDEVNNWANEFDVLMKRISHYFARTEALSASQRLPSGFAKPN